MKLRYHLSAAVLAAALVLAPAVYAGDKHECCTKTTAAVKEGKACPKCAEAACCKETAKAEMKKLTDAGKKPAKCEGCEAKKKAT